MFIYINYYIMLTVLVVLVTGKWLKINKNADGKTKDNFKH